ncbi:SEC14 cytosolic factor, partial [Durusdinium trenchii]
MAAAAACLAHEDLVSMMAAGTTAVSTHCDDATLRLLRAFGGGLGFDDPRVLHLSDGGGGGPRTQVPCPLRLYAPLRRVAHAQFQRQCGWLGGFSHLSTAIAGDFLEPFRAFATQKEGDLASGAGGQLQLWRVGLHLLEHIGGDVQPSPHCPGNYTLRFLRYVRSALLETNPMAGNWLRKFLLLNVLIPCYWFAGLSKLRTTDISCVPHNIDAFYFLDESGIQRNAAALKIWEKRGWKVMSYDMIPGTEGVDSARLTGKELKFAPPKWLASGYDWLVFHDSIRYIDLSNLTSFLVERQSHALVLLDYCRVLSKCCGRDGWFCMNLQVSHYSRKSNFDK